MNILATMPGRHGDIAWSLATVRALAEAYDEPITFAISGKYGSLKELIEARVRPAVAHDGGDITFRGFKDGVVYLDMKGACSGCPSSTATLRHGIQNLLRHYLPDVVEVRPMS